MSFYPTHFAHGSDATPVPGIVGAVLTGPTRSGKSSLALQYCISEALRGNRTKLLCHANSLRARMPRPQCSLGDLEEEVLLRIEFIYVSSFAELCQALGAIMCEGGSAGVVVVEDSEFESVTDSRPVAAALGLLALASRFLKSSFLYVHSGPQVRDLSQFPWAAAAGCALITTEPVGTNTVVRMRFPLNAVVGPALLLTWGPDGYVPSLYTP